MITGLNTRVARSNTGIAAVSHCLLGNSIWTSQPVPHRIKTYNNAWKNATHGALFCVLNKSKARYPDKTDNKELPAWIAMPATSVTATGKSISAEAAQNRAMGCPLK